MSRDTTVIPFRQPEAIDDPLTEVAREGARRMLAPWCAQAPAGCAGTAAPIWRTWRPCRQCKQVPGASFMRPTWTPSPPPARSRRRSAKAARSGGASPKNLGFGLLRGDAFTLMKRDRQRWSAGGPRPVGRSFGAVRRGKSSYSPETGAVACGSSPAP
jgi:hypothetical protein